VIPWWLNPGTTKDHNNDSELVTTKKFIAAKIKFLQKPSEIVLYNMGVWIPTISVYNEYHN